MLKFCPMCRAANLKSAEHCLGCGYDFRMDVPDFLEDLFVNIDELTKRNTKEKE